MGLPKQEKILPQWESPQGYITVLRRNWHLLPFSQILVLLNQTPEHLAESLLEDDFLFVKLGSVKPQCEPLRYSEPTEEQKKKVAQIADWIRTEFGAEWNAPEEPRFEFLKTFFPEKTTTEERKSVPLSPETSKPLFETRFLSSYFATFGDPLLDAEVKSYPDELLRQLAQYGVNGVWLHVVLRSLAPSEMFPEFGKDHEKRIAALNTLVKRADKYGIKVILYMNEPRAMPPSFFTEERTKIAGVPYGIQTAMCTSTPEVQQWLSDSLKFVFKNVPGLGGIFTITASENKTNCASHYQKDKCPRCKERSAAEIIAEVNRIMQESVHSVAPEAQVIAWDWGWSDAVAPEIIEKLPAKVAVQSVSEWSLPIERGGIKSNVGEYSISSVGPGPRAAKHWELARNRGLKTFAKVQFNVTWELAAVPYLPVEGLVAQHVVNLSKSGVNGIMLGWSLGGYPSPNLAIAQLAQEQNADAQTLLRKVAEKYYGDGAAKALEAWQVFADGYKEFPYHIGLCYSGPQEWGAANLVFPQKTNYRATMVGIPYDDVKTWCAVYPPEIAAMQFRKVAAGFAAGLKPLKEAIKEAGASAPANANSVPNEEYTFARAAQLHFDAAANMIEFNTLRDKYLDSKDEAEKANLKAEMKNVLERELQVAKQMYPAAKSDSRIGYESTNHYFYLPIDIAEAVISIRSYLTSLAQPL